MNTTPNHPVEVLLVDDNDCDAELTMHVLAKRNLANHIMHVADGQEALDWLFGEGIHAGRSPELRPRVVLLDLQLPKVNGLDVLRAIRAHPLTRLLPVVILTSSREERDVIEGYQLGVNSYIVKPVTYDNFATAVAAAGHYWLFVNHDPK